MDIPDIIGYIVEEGIGEITKMGYSITKQDVLKPLNVTEPVGVSRIIRINKLQDENIEILIAYQDYKKGGV